jgi:hypothetical protein
LQWIEWALKNPDNTVVQVSPVVRPFIDAMSMWTRNSSIRIESTERVVYSLKNRYAGTVDAIGRNANGKLVVIDWKTSNSMHVEYALQLAAYAKAIEEMDGECVEEAYVVRFDKNSDNNDAQTGMAKIEQKRVKNLDDTFAAFDACLRLFHFSNNDVFESVN